MNNTLHHYPPATDAPLSSDFTVTHEAIAERAREIWLAQGCPENCDEAIWLEAEAELLAIQQKRYRHPNLQLGGRSDSQTGRVSLC
jgi:hypothetical protein